MVVDANGQASVSYLDQQGRVVATALAGDPPANLESLGHAGVAFEVDLIDQDPLDEVEPSGKERERLESSFHYLASSAGEHDFAYQLQGDTFRADACPLCFACTYSFEATVLDQCGRTVPAVEPGSEIGLPFFEDFGEIAFGEQCPAPVSDLDPDDPDSDSLDFTVDFDLAKYNVHKSLAVRQGTLDAYLDAYLADGRCARSLQDFLDDELARTDFSACRPVTDCAESCELEVAGLGPRPDPDPFLARCVEDCERSDGCPQLRQILMGDLEPGGQYATFEIDDQGEYAATGGDSALNVLNTKTTPLPGRLGLRPRGGGDRRRGLRAPGAHSRAVRPTLAALLGRGPAPVPSGEVLRRAGVLRGLFGRGRKLRARDA